MFAVTAAIASMSPCSPSAYGQTGFCKVLPLGHQAHVLGQADLPGTQVAWHPGDPRSVPQQQQQG